MVIIKNIINKKKILGEREFKFLKDWRIKIIEL